jgi:hypothetical protein
MNPWTAASVLHEIRQRRLRGGYLTTSLMKLWCGFLLLVMYGVALATDQHVDPPEKIARLYNNWVGKPSSALIEQWGTPKNAWRLANASGGLHVFLGYTQPVVDCDTIFRGNADDKIESWRQYGSQCPSRKRFRQGKRGAP